MEREINALFLLLWIPDTILLEKPCLDLWNVQKMTCLFNSNPTNHSSYLQLTINHMNDLNSDVISSYYNGGGL